DHIGIYASNCAEWVEVMLGAYKARAVPVNVNYRYVDDELRYLFDNADLVGLLYQPEYAERVAAVRDDVPTLRFTLELGDDYERVRKAPDSGLLGVLVCPPLMHGGGQWTTLSGLLGGAVIALLEGRFDAVRVWEIVTREGANTMSLIGDAMARPLADAYRASPDAYDTSKLFVIGSGGAPLTPTVKRELKELLPHVLIMDSFGASETGYQ